MAEAEMLVALTLEQEAIGILEALRITVGRSHQQVDALVALEQVSVELVVGTDPSQDRLRGTPEPRRLSTAASISVGLARICARSPG
jgi:hypothetical protein